ncbi:U4/U6 small nuclear ribonucleo protein PRP4 [Aspergillus pseudotamarii]|uniref:non-specific serine/threonine protein kinase n=1 Tax=Aspergillus pseudotamarii TaxID=132259 RepID=A0A5N6SZ74_ASPPS|nr:U4/U6 small nuclear ribonucleo protein PRP4 [Aspergillus pseudotamarii]KAE8139207.1 U4/U6 small nuclear ribonucleo protein PRP4 [Aspergillus pseudotamarii]
MHRTLCFATFNRLALTRSLSSIIFLSSRSALRKQRRTVMSSSQWTSEPRVFSPAGFGLLDTSLKIEEETLPTYQPEKYYPTQIGEVLDNRYQVLAKLGYGVTSTVWFGRDLVESKYIALKIFVKDRERNHELDIYHRINSVESDHPGKRFIRKLLHHFTIAGPHGQHICLVHEPLGISASDLIRWIPGRAMSLEDLKPYIQLKNLLLPTPMPKALSDFEEQEVKTQSARKVLHDRTIYTSSRFPPGDGLPLLSDFGEARFGDQQHSEDIMPNHYRAPEVILRSSWDYKVDIWNVGMVAWDIVSPFTLVDGRNPDGVFDDRFHLAELVALLGSPPPAFRQRSHLSSVFWDNAGNWKGLTPIPDKTLEGLAVNIKGEDKEGFLRWLRRALQWNPDDRPTALELLYDEWMMKGLKLGNKTES